MTNFGEYQNLKTYI